MNRKKHEIYALNYILNLITHTLSIKPRRSKGTLLSVLQQSTIMVPSKFMGDQESIWTVDFSNHSEYMKHKSKGKQVGSKNAPSDWDVESEEAKTNRKRSQYEIMP